MKAMRIWGDLWFKDGSTASMDGTKTTWIGDVSEDVVYTAQDFILQVDPSNIESFGAENVGGAANVVVEWHTKQGFVEATYKTMDEVKDLFNQTEEMGKMRVIGGIEGGIKFKNGFKAEMNGSDVLLWDIDNKCGTYDPYEFLDFVRGNDMQDTVIGFLGDQTESESNVGITWADGGMTTYHDIQAVRDIFNCQVCSECEKAYSIKEAKRVFGHAKRFNHFCSERCFTLNITRAEDNATGAPIKTKKRIRELSDLKKSQIAGKNFLKRIRHYQISLDDIEKQMGIIKDFEERWSADFDCVAEGDLINAVNKMQDEINQHKTYSSKVVIHLSFDDIKPGFQPTKETITNWLKSTTSRKNMTIEDVAVYNEVSWKE